VRCISIELQFLTAQKPNFLDLLPIQDDDAFPWADSSF
jgi:hypothetical protein